jgi:beta-galactosidase/beta-glucuronidase
MLRNEYPRPQFKRANWINLNGEWMFEFDDQDRGWKERWFLPNVEFSKKINVPFVYQAKLSGINDKTPHDIVWYKRTFRLDTFGCKTLLHFGAVDYQADIFVNGNLVCSHSGGHTPIDVDITPFFKEEEQQLAVRVYDPHEDESIPRGKQFWEEKPRGIWYTASTGIWQSVWIEQVAETHLVGLRYTPLFDEGKVQVEAELNHFQKNKKLHYQIFSKSLLIGEGTLKFFQQKLDFVCDIFQQKIFRTNFHGEGWDWTPENPHLFDIHLEILNEADQVIDEVQSYFGMRKVHIENGMVYLNNRPYYQKLVLDQGYWPEGLLTAPTDEAFVKDITLAKEMGFNGCRKHQKMEDPRFLYWADKLGYIVWGECAAPPIFNNLSTSRLMSEWTEIIKRDYNHPCILTWVPINESWGVPNIHFDRQEQHFSQAMYHYLHALDKTRLVISNDGWEMTETDICAIHNYAHGEKSETDKYAEFKETLLKEENLVGRASHAAWRIYAQGFIHQQSPIMLTEFGGIGFQVSDSAGWGYTSANTEEEFISEYERIMKAVYASKALWGYCYTQLYDVEQELNGFVTYDRELKCNLSRIKEINDSSHLIQLYSAK